MRTVTAIDAKDRFGELLDAAQREPVTVTQDGQPAAVMLSIADYDRLRGAARRKLTATLEQAHRDAAAAGLTEEKLDQLLADGG